jgi:hypothetical protein
MGIVKEYVASAGFRDVLLVYNFGILGQLQRF